ncbi:response regulator [Hyalangium gracile]|uniref:response regulator n=1 Tax=Hyalangium gracile TaxID=394092 RepID=UPI001CCA25B2|nr:response regulator [Hyalangium gracile]
MTALPRKQDALARPSLGWGWAAALAAALGVLLATLPVALALQEERRKHFENELNIELRRAKEKVEAQIEDRILALVRMARRWERSPASKEEWEADATFYYQHFKSFQAIEWADPSQHIRWVIPLEGNGAVLGLDLGAEARRRESIRQAEERGEVVVSRTVELAQRGRGFLVLVPIARQGPSQGTLIGVFRIQDTLETILGQDFQSRFAMTVFDGDERIYHRELPGEPERGEWAQEGTFQVRNVEWRVRLQPAPSRMDPLWSMLPGAVLAAGGLVSVLVFIAVSLAFKDRWRARQFEALTRFQSAILDGTNYAIVSTHSSGIIRVFNKGAERLTGYRAEEVIGRVTPLIFHDPQELEARARQLSQELGQEVPPDQVFLAAQRLAGRGADGEWTYIRKDGSRVLIQLSLSAIRDAQGHISQFAGIAFDVSLRKQAELALVQAKEAAEEAARVKSDFLARMSHEIRTPLNGVIGMVDLTLGTPLSHQQRDFLETAQHSAHALLRLIDDLLHFSKLEARKLRLETLPFRLRDLLGETLKPLALRAHAKGLELLMAVPEDVPDALVGDPHRLRQVLLNLLENALKFTERGEVIVSVEREGHLSGQVRLRFSVTDTGIGIPEDKLAHVFEAFTQADEATTRKYGGTGLGLSICSQLVSLMGGRLQAESKVGRGSRFHFALALPLDGEPPARGLMANGERLSGLSVLVMVENASHRRILAELLRGWRMVPHEVSEPAAALAALEARHAAGSPIQLAILEVKLNERGGWDTARAMRADPRGASVPIILLLSTNESQVAGVPELEPCAWLLKPVSPSVLLETVQSLLSGGPRRLVSASQPGAGAPTRKPREVLVVEDNAVNQRIVTVLLERAGHHVFSVGTGLAAIEALRTRHYDVVLMDVQMPGMDGLEATRIIRSEEALRGGHVPIIALTAQDMKGDAQRCLDAGMDGYIAKPLKLATLLSALEELSVPGEARPPPRPSSGEPMDRERLLGHVGGDVQLMKEVVELFLAERPRLWAALDEAMARGDAREAARAAHKVKGALLNLTAEPAAAAARRLEEAAHQGHMEEAREALERLRLELVRLQGALEELSSEA